VLVLHNRSAWRPSLDPEPGAERVDNVDAPGGAREKVLGELLAISAADLILI
jgi:hypothetical protein